MTVIRDAAGRYFASFVVETDPAADARRFRKLAEVGIDLGLAAFAVLSDGTKVSAPRFLRRAEKKLRRLQRAHSRKQKAARTRRSRGRGGPRARHGRGPAGRLLPPGVHDDHPREPSGVRGGPCRSGSAGPGWRNRCTTPDGPPLWHAGVQGRPYGRTFPVTGRFEPTAQVCSACGIRTARSRSASATGRAACGTVHDRDINAAINVLAQVRRESLNACGGGVRPGATLAAAGETGSLRGAA